MTVIFALMAIFLGIGRTVAFMLSGQYLGAAVYGVFSLLGAFCVISDYREAVNE